jgi:hypothetical protein
MWRCNTTTLSRLACLGSCTDLLACLLRCCWCVINRRRKRESTFSARHPNSTLPAFDAAKDVVKDTTSGVMDYGVRW